MRAVILEMADLNAGIRDRTGAAFGASAATNNDLRRREAIFVTQRGVVYITTGASVVLEPVRLFVLSPRLSCRMTMCPPHKRVSEWQWLIDEIDLRRLFHRPQNSGVFGKLSRKTVQNSVLNRPA